MSAVMCTTYKLTGVYKVKRTLFGPRIYVEEIMSSFDTNSGFKDPNFIIWRRARNKDINPVRVEGLRDSKIFLT